MHVVAIKNVDLESLVDDFVTFYVAGNAALIVTHKYLILPSGQDTTANAMSIAIILTHQHPQILDRYIKIWYMQNN